MKAVAYIRVSTDEQVRGTSLDSQEKACLKYAEANGIDLSKENIFREEGISAKLIDRPQLAKMLDYCMKNKGKISHCIIWKVDRLARKAEYHHIIRARLHVAGVKLVSVTEPLSDDPAGRLMEVMLAGFAQFDNEVRAARTTGGMTARLQQGGWPHTPPYGYKRAYTPSNIVTIEPNEDAWKVRKILHEYATGAYTIQQLREYAQSIGLTAKNGKMRSWQIIKDYVANPIYAGFVTSEYLDGKRVKGLHEPLISEATYLRNKSLLDGSVANYSKHAETEWPLRGGFLRHICGKPMTGSAPRGRGGPSPRYSCPVCKAKILKISVSKAKESVHMEFVDLLEQVRPSEPTLRLFKEIALKEWNNEIKSVRELSRALEIEITALEDKKSRVLDLFIDNKISEEEKEKKLAEIEASRSKLIIRQSEVKSDMGDKEAIIDGALLFMSNPGSFWNVAPIELKKRIQDMIFPEGLVYDCDKGFRTAKIATSYLLTTKIAQKGDLNPTLVAATGIEPVTLGL